MPISVTKKFEFEAAHHLPGHPGLCRNLHGHSYKLEVEVTGSLNDTGMIIDFGDLKKIVNKEIIGILDHRNLNELYDMPTAEVMVEDIAIILSEKIENVIRVRLYETSGSYAEWKR